VEALPGAGATSVNKARLDAAAPPVSGSISGSLTAGAGGMIVDVAGAATGAGVAAGWAVAGDMDVIISPTRALPMPACKPAATRARSIAGNEVGELSAAD
jgi:hypothetical protein